MVNSCNFIGRVGQIPEVRTLQSGDKLASFSMALSEKWTDKSGEKKEKTTWINLVCFGKQAEIIEKYVQKGALLYVESKVQVEQYEDKDGKKMTATKFNIKNFTMLGGNEPKESSGQHSSMSQPSQGSSAFDDDGDSEGLPF